MNVTENIERIMNAKSDLKMSISNKGVEIPDGTLIDEYSSYVDQISSGGGTVDSGGKYLVQVIDYDGTVLKQDHLNEGDTFTLPEAPTNHSRLVFQGWSSPVNIVNNTVTVGNSDITIGAMYKTASGATEFDITLTKVTGKKVTFQNLTGMTSIDWGDGTTNSSLSHTYSIEGDYTIKVYGVTAIGDNVFKTSLSNPNYFTRNIFIADSVTSIGNSVFRFCYSLTSVTIPNGVTNIGTFCFSSCYSLTSVTIPSSVTSIGEECFYSCYSLTSVTIPNGVTNIEYSFLRSCYSLTSVTIPNGVTSIEGYCFYSCSSLTSVTIPSSVTSIGGYCFDSCRSIILFDFSNHTSIPTLSSTSAFTYIKGIAKILVPASLYEEWIAATNWATYADYIYYVGELPMPTEEISLAVDEVYSDTLAWYCDYPSGSSPSSAYPVMKLFKDEDYENNLMLDNQNITPGYIYSTISQDDAYLSSDYYDNGTTVQYGYYIYNFKVLQPGKYEWTGYYPGTGLPIRKYILNVT